MYVFAPEIHPTTVSTVSILQHLLDAIIQRIMVEEKRHSSYHPFGNSIEPNIAAPIQILSQPMESPSLTGNKPDELTEGPC